MFHRNLIMLVVLTLTSLLRGIHSENIFISQSANAEDAANCGNSTSPCRTIAYGLSKIREDVGIVNIDGGKNLTQPFIYPLNDTIKIDYSITLRKWNRYNQEQGSPNPIIFCEKRDKYSHLHIRSNASFVSVDIQTNIQNWIQIGYYSSKHLSLYILNCSFGFGSAKSILVDTLGEWRYLYVRHSQVNIYNLRNRLFLSFSPSTSWISLGITDNVGFITNSCVSNSEMKELWYSRISITNSTFYNVSIEWTGVESLKLNTSSFKSSSFYVHFIEKTVILNSIFDNTVARFYFFTIRLFRYLYIYNATFMNKESRKKEPALTVQTSAMFTFPTIILSKCSFKNNTASESSWISSLDINVPNAKCTLYSCRFYGARKSNKLFVLNKNKLHSFFTIDTSLICEEGQIPLQNNTHFITAENKKGKSLQVFCLNCEKSTYHFATTTNFLNLSGSSKNRNVKTCISCPYNAICENGQIKLKSGYWGYKDTRTSPNTLSLVPCPPYYCCSSEEDCYSYNTCGPHRKGRLCSQCQQGFSSDISSKYQCIHNSQCHNAKLTFTLYTLFGILFIFIMMYLKELILTFQRCKNVIARDASPYVNNDINPEDAEELQERLLHESLFAGDRLEPIPYQILHSNEVSSETYHKNSSKMLSGALKITLFFYQAVTLIRIQCSSKMELNFPKFFDILTTFFNIKLDLSHSKLAVCILPDLDIIHVKIIKIGFIVIVFTIIAIVWVVASIVKIFRKRKNNSRKRLEKLYVQIDDNVPSYCNPPFIVRVKCVFLQFLLIAYASVAVFCFDTVYCVDINGESYLYSQASIKCYQYWQYGMIMFIVLFVAPFALSLHIGSKLLFKCFINPTEFLAILTFPPAILMIMVKRKFLSTKEQQMNREEAMLAKHLLLVINEPFRNSTDSDDSKLCWESILIIRRMLLVIAQTFIAPSIGKLYPIAVLFFLFAFHHQKMKPFSNPVLNEVEFASLLILQSMVFVNLFWAITREFELTLFPFYKSMGLVLMYYEMLVLSLPFILLMLYITHKLFQKAIMLICQRFNKKQD